jgi:hypothetical protein
MSIVIDWGTLLFIVFIPLSFIFISKYLAIFLIFFSIYYFIVILYEARIYIIKIISYDNEIEIFYYFKNIGVKKCVIPKNTFSIDWYDTVKGNITGARIIIYGKNCKITQYSTGGWKKNTLKKIYEKLNMQVKNLNY